MAYIGQQPFQEFASVPTKDSFTGDGSTTTFDLANDVVRGGENALEVFVDNVRQEPGSGKAFTLGVDGSNNYRRITFSAAPANSAVIYVINDKTNLSAIAPVNTDFNGAELVLDADADTTFHADTDDEIDIRIGGNDVIMLKQSSGDGIITIPTDAKDLQFTQFDGYKVLEINDGGFVGVGGNSNAAGEIRIFEDTDNGSNYSGFKAAASTTSSVAYTLPAADGSSGTHLTTDGSGALSWTASVTLANDSNNRVITGTGSGLNGETNLTFDGSTLALTGAMTVSTNNTIAFRDSGLTIGSNADGDLDIVSDGTAVDSINIESAGGITLDAGTAGSGIIYEDDGTEMMRIHNSSSDVIVESKVSDKDIIFKVNDGGSATEVFRVDGDVSALLVASGKELRFADSGEKISGNGTDLTLNSGADINLTATTDINVPANVGITFGDDAEKIEGDGTDLTISGNNINLTATADVNIPSGVGLTFATAEKIESDGTDLSITVGSNGDINIPANIGLTFGDDGEKIEGDGTDLTIAGNNINLTATADVVIPANVGITFGTGEKIEGDSTDLTVTSGAKINLTATSDVHIPNNVGIVFGGDSEKIEGDGTDMTISANNLTVDAAADITLDAAGNDLNFAAGGTTVLTITNSSSDVVVKPIVDTKDLIFQQRDGTEVMRIEDGAYMSLAAMAVNPEVALSDGSDIAWNVLTSPVAKVTLAGNRNLSAASGGVAGQFVSLLVIQDGTGSRTLTPNAVYEFTGDVAPTLTTTANKGDLFVFRYNGSKYLEVGRNLNLTLS